MDELLHELVGNLAESKELLQDYLRKHPKVTTDPEFALLMGLLGAHWNTVEDLKIYETNFNK